MSEKTKIIAPKDKKKEKIKAEVNSVRFWDSIQTRSGNKVTMEAKYRASLKEMRSEIGINVVRDFIFGIPNNKIPELIEARAEIDDKFTGLCMDTSYAGNGDYVYSKDDYDMITAMKRL